MTSARSRLPNRRFHEVFEFEHLGIVYTVGVGRYGDGRIGEVFLEASRVGTPLWNQARDVAVLLSLMLQHNFPMGVVRHAVTRLRGGEAAGPVGVLLDLLFADTDASGEPPLVPPDLLAAPAAPGAPDPLAAAALVSTKTRSEQGGCS